MSVIPTIPDAIVDVTAPLRAQSQRQTGDDSFFVPGLRVLRHPSQRRTSFGETSGADRKRWFYFSWTRCLRKIRRSLFSERFKESHEDQRCLCAGRMTLRDQAIDGQAQYQVPANRPLHRAVCIGADF